VRFGASVTVVDVESDEETTYQLVGPYEADLAKKKISVQSPLGRALIGKTIGDTAEVSAPGGSKGYEVLKVKFK
jgi:transcription elongation factor GreA